MSTVAGYLLASRWQIDWVVFAATVVGTSLVIAASCTINNYLDRHIDEKMIRTKERELVSGIISPVQALSYAAILAILGFGALIAWTNWYVVGAGALGMLFYVVIYGWAKRTTTHGTLVGTISGSMPIVAGYLAVSNGIDLAAILLFLVMTTWQMPHFYAIALRRAKEYEAAGIPVLPVIKGVRRTKFEMVCYTFLFTASVVLLSLNGVTGAMFLLVMGPLSLYWLWRGVQGLDKKDALAWGDQMFGLSLIVLLSLSVMLSVGSVLP